MRQPIPNLLNHPTKSAGATRTDGAQVFSHGGLDHACSSVDTTAAPKGDDGDEVVHDVSWLEWFLGDVLRLKIPRGRCGVLLVGDPNRPDPIDLGAPMCPRCAELAGYDPDEVDRFNRRMQ